MGHGNVKIELFSYFHHQDVVSRFSRTPQWSQETTRHLHQPTHAPQLLTDKTSTSDNADTPSDSVDGTSLPPSDFLTGPSLQSHSHSPSDQPITQHDSETAHQALSSAPPPGTLLRESTTSVALLDEPGDFDDHSTSSIDDIFNYGNTFNYDYGINAIRSERFALLSSADILHDDEEDADLDFNDITHHHAPLSTTPIKYFLARITAENVPTPDAAFLHRILSDTPSTESPVLFDGPRAHFDDGSQVSTTHEASRLHSYRRFTSHNPCSTRLVPADGKEFVTIGYGILRVPAPNQQGFRPVLCFHTPQIPSTILCPKSLEDLLIAKQHNDGTSLHKFPRTRHFTFVVHHSLRRSQNITLHGTLISGLCYTGPIILPKHDAVPSSPDSADNVALLRSLFATHNANHVASGVVQEFRLHRLHVRAERLLWHQRLGHPSDHYLYNAHKHIEGVPCFQHHDPVLEQ